jgi:hypothetical protein
MNPKYSSVVMQSEVLNSMESIGAESRNLHNATYASNDIVINERESIRVRKINEIKSFQPANTQVS